MPSNVCWERRYLNLMEKHKDLKHRFIKLIAHIRYYERKYKELAELSKGGGVNNSIHKSVASSFSLMKTLARDYKDNKAWLKEIRALKESELILLEGEENARKKDKD